MSGRGRGNDMHPNGKEALKTLMAGNARFVAGAVERPNQTQSRRAETAGGQHPFAAVVACSDSRVPPEVIFDRGIGDLFVVRVAGNIASDAVIGSVEYAALHLGVPLILVLGHTGCGAVEAAIAGGEATGRIRGVIESIGEAVERARGRPGRLSGNAVRENVALVVEELKSAEPVLAELVAGGRLTVTGAVYDIESGAVELL